MSIELITIVITATISLLDLMVNCFSICCKGRLKINTKCAQIEHESSPKSDLDTEQINDITEQVKRRMSI